MASPNPGNPKRFDPRVNRGDRLSTGHHEPSIEGLKEGLTPESTVDLGWGRLIFGQTFPDHGSIRDVLLDEGAGQRDIAMYLRDPQVLVGSTPAELFIDPSLTYRLWMHRYRSRRDPVKGIVVRPMDRPGDAEEINRIYAACGMVTAEPDVMSANHRHNGVVYLLAVDTDRDEIVGTVTGIDHTEAFGDPESGSSLWCLAVDPQTARPGVGEALVRHLSERFKARGRAYMDLSVLHDNTGAIRLYEKLGFERVPVFLVKRKNPINEGLYTAMGEEGELNPYAKIIADEAHRRGIAVNVVDAESGLMKLTYGGRTIATRESLSDLTTAVAMTRCADKRLTRRLLEGAGLSVPAGRVVGRDAEDLTFLDAHGEVVVKPARGEQGNGITVGVRTPDHLMRAIDEAARVCPIVLMEELADGEDLRIIVIDGKVIAAAVRRPAMVVGDGRKSLDQLIGSQSRRRQAATGGESVIPLDDHTYDTIADQGFATHDIVPAGTTVQVRRTANLHTGGTIHDVTARLHPTLAEAAVTAAEVLDIPVVGIDLLVPDVERPEYVIIEANERPGLANHEPQPTAQAFLDLLFPRTRRTAGVPARLPRTDTPEEATDE